MIQASLDHTNVIELYRLLVTETSHFALKSRYIFLFLSFQKKRSEFNFFKTSPSVLILLDPQSLISTPPNTEQFTVSK